MNAKEKCITAESTLKQSTQKVIVDGVDALEKIGLDLKNQSIEIIEDSAVTMQEDVAEFNEMIKSQASSFKSDLMDRRDVIQKRLNLSQQNLKDVGDVVKVELKMVFKELFVLAKEIKQDVSQITLKHKAQLNETLKRSQEHTLEVWHKVSSK